ncbi:CDP-archaeol synthase [Candidatus Peribacteria bacterium]|nr:CDP-archaeol synthase [Candidatus Peribacteria bacterium]
MSFANLLEIFIIFSPAFIANAVPVVAKNIPYIRRFSQPIHVYLFGKNKTVRGLLTGVLAGMCLGALLYLFRGFIVRVLPTYSDFYNIYLSWTEALFFGGWIGLGALTGDMIKSFFKRRMGIKPGAMFQPWDGIDYMLGAIIFMLPWYNGGPVEYIFLLIIGPILSLLMNTCAYQIGWKECWY